MGIKTTKAETYIWYCDVCGDEINTIKFNKVCMCFNQLCSKCERTISITFEGKDYNGVCCPHCYRKQKEKLVPMLEKIAAQRMR